MSFDFGDGYGSLLARLGEIQEWPAAGAPLHAPVFAGNERKYVLDAIDSTFVSSVGAYVDRFERMLEAATGAKRAVACVNGTAALEVALRLAGVEAGEVVATQSLSFVATANAIRHADAEPAFVDVERETLGMAPAALEEFFRTRCERAEGKCRLRNGGKRIAACVPMHTFGHPCRMEEILDVCGRWNVAVVEDAAEALGSWRGGRHCGTFSPLGTLSFNGNKIVTTGGGGAVLTNDEALGRQAKHWTTTAKVPHRWEFRHDATAWNYRMPNLNAALGCAQLERLDGFVRIKRERAERYERLFAGTRWEFVREPAGTRANYWLCAVLTENRAERDAFLAASNDAQIQTRPAWEPLHTLSMYEHCLRGELPVTTEMAGRLVNVPSGVGEMKLDG